MTLACAEGCLNRDLLDMVCMMTGCNASVPATTGFMDVPARAECLAGHVYTFNPDVVTWRCRECGALWTRPFDGKRISEPATLQAFRLVMGSEDFNCEWCMVIVPAADSHAAIGEGSETQEICLPCLSECRLYVGDTIAETQGKPEPVASSSSSARLNCACVCHLNPHAYRICPCLCHRIELPIGQDCKCYHEKPSECHCLRCAANEPVLS